MNEHTLILARRAVRICAAYRKQADQRLDAANDRIDRVRSEVDMLMHIRRRLRIWRARGWQYAAKAQLTELESTLRGVREELDDCRRAIEYAGKPVPEPRHFLDELRQLEEEFDGVLYDSEHQQLSVVTRPIVLEGIPLGRFEVQSELNRGDNPDLTSFLRIVAKEPNPAACDDTVTHPHVRHERLCAGEAAAAMGQALAGARLCDLFMLARSVLETYNADSPHVALGRWDGYACHDCGSTMNSDESSFCGGCEHDFCDECFSYCRGCDASLCCGCLSPCRTCDDRCCESCLSPCASCERDCCSKCLNELLCPTCQPQEENPCESDTGNNQPPAVGSENGIDGEPTPQAAQLAASHPACAAL